MRRFVQSLLALAFCGVLVATLGPLYAVAAIVATVIALMSGVYIALAVGVGFLWPILALAWILYVTRETSRRAAEGAAAAPPLWGPKPVLPRAEDARHRQR
jgi:hypothetical protein